MDDLNAEFFLWGVMGTGILVSEEFSCIGVGKFNTETRRRRVFLVGRMGNKNFGFRGIKHNNRKTLETERKLANQGCRESRYTFRFGDV